MQNCARELWVLKFQVFLKRYCNNLLYCLRTNCRYSGGTTISASDCSTIESMMTLSLNTTIKIKKRVLDPEDTTLAEIYKPLGRCVAIVDDKVAGIYGQDIDQYFEVSNIDLS